MKNYCAEAVKGSEDKIFYVKHPIGKGESGGR